MNLVEYSGVRCISVSFSVLEKFSNKKVKNKNCCKGPEAPVFQEQLGFC
jgi:hypothetical protein